MTIMYEIENYKKLYNPTNSSGGELLRAKYVKVPVKPRGKGLRALLKNPKGLEVFGIWCLLLEAATETTIPDLRGRLLNHKDEPASIEEIAESISLDRQRAKVKNALSVLVEMGWMKYTPNTESIQNDSVEAPAAPTPKIREDKIKVSKEEDKGIFDIFRKLYPGKKNGLEPEWKNFVKKHKNYGEILPLLEPALEAQVASRESLLKAKEFVPAWKHLKTWVNNSCWTEEPAQPANKQKSTAELTANVEKFF